MNRYWKFVVALTGLSLSGHLNAQVCSQNIGEVYVAMEDFADNSVIFREREAGTGEIDVILYSQENDCRPLVVDSYEIEGGSPSIEDTFVHPVNGESNLFTIVSWPMDHAGAGLRGRFYAVYAYQAMESGLTLNDLISESREISSGAVGMVEGEEVAFAGATREGVISLLASLDNPGSDWAALCDLNGNQAELTACAFVEQQEAREELEAMLATLESAYEEVPHMLEALNRTQLAWETQLGLDLQNLFPVGPGEDVRVLYGSSYSMQYAYARSFLIRQRVDFLRAHWLPQDYY